MTTTSLIGQDSYVTGLHKQAAAQAAALQNTSGKNQDLKKVHDAAQKFEAFFISQMMEHMTAGLETNPLFGGGHGEEMWKSMLNQEYGNEIAKSNRLGITDQVMKGMLKMQEQRDAGGQVVAQAAQQPDTSNTADTAQTQQDAAIALVAATRLPIRR